MDISALLGVERGVTALIGGGGKTTLMCTLAEELRRRGTVVVTTSTHIQRPEQYPVLLSGGAAAVSAALAAHGAVCVAGETAEGKLTAPDPVLLEYALRRADAVFLEADGAKHFPCKAPAEHEPVLLPECDIVLAVAGLSALGKPLAQCCFRLEQACALLGVPPETPLTPPLLAKLLASEAGGRKGVAERRFWAVLNQADDAARRTAGEQTLALLRRQYGVQGVLTFFEQEEYA